MCISQMSEPRLWPAARHTTWRASFLPYNSYTITEPCSHSSLLLQAVSWRKLVETNLAQLEERVDADIYAPIFGIWAPPPQRPLGPWWRSLHGRPA